MSKRGLALIAALTCAYTQPLFAVSSERIQVLYQHMYGGTAPGSADQTQVPPAAVVAMDGFTPGEIPEYDRDPFTKRISQRFNAILSKEEPRKRGRPVYLLGDSARPQGNILMNLAAEHAPGEQAAIAQMLLSSDSRNRPYAHINMAFDFVFANAYVAPNGPTNLYLIIAGGGLEAYQAGIQAIIDARTLPEGMKLHLYLIAGFDHESIRANQPHGGYRSGFDGWLGADHLAYVLSQHGKSLLRNASVDVTLDLYRPGPAHDPKAYQFEQIFIGSFKNYARARWLAEDGIVSARYDGDVVADVRTRTSEAPMVATNILMAWREWAPFEYVKISDYLGRTLENATMLEPLWGEAVTQRERMKALNREFIQVLEDARDIRERTMGFREHSRIRPR